MFISSISVNHFLCNDLIGRRTFTRSCEKLARLRTSLMELVMFVSILVVAVVVKHRRH